MQAWPLPVATALSVPEGIGRQVGLASQAGDVGARRAVPLLDLPAKLWQAAQHPPVAGKGAVPCQLRIVSSGARSGRSVARLACVCE